MAATWASLGAEVEALAAAWRADRPARQARRHLEPGDFDALSAAGWFLVGAEERDGGLWHDVASSTRPIGALLRTLAGGDPSVALVSAMHPAVLCYWLAMPEAGSDRWRQQRRAASRSAAAGLQWGTITSEPGSGGDILRTVAAAVADDALEPHPDLPGAGYRITGDKHFGSGSGINDLMITTALPDDGGGPTIFVLDLRDTPWDGSTGLQLLAEWDGAGMAATQSHAMRLSGCPAVRMAWDGPIEEISAAAVPFVATMFTSVVLGVLDEAVAVARAQLAPKVGGLRAYEQVEWTRAEMDHWLAVQAYEGALRAIEAGPGPAAMHAALRAKAAVAELAEATLARLTRVLGGGTFARRSPFSAWFEDVRALGFLRPPWGLAFDQLLATSFPPPPG